MNVAIFGGTFNPVHIEHIRLARAAVNLLELDKLFIVPTFIPPHKSITPAPAQDRLNMLNIAFENDSKIEVCNFEIENGGKSFSYITAEHFASLYPNENRYFIVGGDMLVDFKTWREPQRILNVCTLAVFDRENCTIDYEREGKYFKKYFNTNFIRLNFIGKDDSSTEIRTFVALGLDITDKTDTKVADYIKAKDLYIGGNYERYVRENLTEKRLIHTAGVITTVLKKCQDVGVKKEDAYTAALLHDCAKYKTAKDFPDYTLPSDVPEPVAHAFYGAYVAEYILKIDNQEIIDAIRYHTSGKAKMSTLGKLIFVADMVEKNRAYDGVDRLRALYNNGDFEICFRECLKEEVLHIVEKKSYIYKETLNAYDYYIKNQGE